MRIKSILNSGTWIRLGFAEEYTDHSAASGQINFLIVFNIETKGEGDHFEALGSQLKKNFFTDRFEVNFATNVANK